MTGVAPSGKSFCIAHLASFVDFVAAKAKVGGGGLATVGVHNGWIAALGYLAPLLRGVVFLSQPHFGAGADSQSVSLCAVRS